MKKAAKKKKKLNVSNIFKIIPLALGIIVVRIFLLQTYPNIQLGPLVLFPFKHFGGSIRRAATPRRQRLPCVVKVSKPKVYKTQRYVTVLLSK